MIRFFVVSFTVVILNAALSDKASVCVCVCVCVCVWGGGGGGGEGGGCMCSFVFFNPVLQCTVCLIYFCDLYHNDCV